METRVEFLSQGTITSPRGFQAGATCAGIKSGHYGKLDLGIFYSEVPSTAAGVFTNNKIKAAPVVLSQKRLLAKRAQAIVVNSGCANACTGEPGLANALHMAVLSAKKLGIQSEDVMVASTGVIGIPLPMERLQAGIEKISLSNLGGHEMALAIMTTDTVPKEAAIAAETGGIKFILGGIAKGAGMIHPDMATLLCFLATDAAVEADFLQSALKGAVEASFNMITIDGDTSPNDMVLFLANGLAGNRLIEAGSAEAETFYEALCEVCLFLAKSIARDGEGATRLVEVTVEGALTTEDARAAARTIAGSALVKAAVHGCDPNWGRIMAALGRSGAKIEESKLDLYLGNLCLTKAGCPQPFDNDEARSILGSAEVSFRVCLNLGGAKATAWGCDLSEEYVTINSAYTT